MEQSPNQGPDLVPFTGSLIPITMVPKYISETGKFGLILELESGVNGGFNSLTLIVVGTGTVADGLEALFVDGSPIRLLKDFAQAVLLDFRYTSSILVEGKIVADRTIQFAILGAAGHSSITIRGRSAGTPLEE